MTSITPTQVSGAHIADVAAAAIDRTANNNAAMTLLALSYAAFGITEGVSLASLIDGLRTCYAHIQSPRSDGPGASVSTRADH